MITRNYWGLKVISLWWHYRLKAVKPNLNKEVIKLSLNCFLFLFLILTVVIDFINEHPIFNWNAESIGSLEVFNFRNDIQ